MAIRSLNNIDHKDLKVDARPHKRYGDFVNCALVFATEYPELHKEFPILIHKNPDSQEFSSHVILGLEKDENLFIKDHEWQTRSIPATLARGPFSIGYHPSEQDSEEVLIMVDEEDPRCGVGDGEAVYLPYGGETPYLEYIKKTLQKIENGFETDRVFFGLLQELNLLEPASITITLTPEKQIGFSGYYTINQDRLAKLDGNSLERLNAAGVLSLVFYLVSSLVNFQRLIALKNARSPES